MKQVIIFDVIFLLHYKYDRLKIKKADKKEAFQRSFIIVRQGYGRFISDPIKVVYTFLGFFGALFSLLLD